VALTKKREGAIIRVFDDSVVYKVVLGGDDGPEHVGYPGGIEDDQVFQRQVAAIRVS